MLRCQPVKERLNADAWHRWWQITFLSFWGLSRMKELIAFRDFCHRNCTQECVCRVMWGEPLEPRDPNFWSLIWVAFCLQVVDTVSLDFLIFCAIGRFLTTWMSKCCPHNSPFFDLDPPRWFPDSEADNFEGDPAVGDVKKCQCSKE